MDRLVTPCQITGYFRPLRIEEYNLPIYHYDFLPENLSEWSLRWDDKLETLYRSLNHPFGRYHAFVCVGPGGIMKKEIEPTTNVRNPSMRNKYRHPAFPPIPRIRKMPVARKALTMSAE